MADDAVELDNPPTNDLGEVEPPIPDPNAGPHEGDEPTEQPGPEPEEDADRG